MSCPLNSYTTKGFHNLNVTNEQPQFHDELSANYWSVPISNMIYTLVQSVTLLSSSLRFETLNGVVKETIIPLVGLIHYPIFFVNRGGGQSGCLSIVVGARVWQKTTYTLVCHISAKHIYEGTHGLACLVIQWIIWLRKNWYRHYGKI